MSQAELSRLAELSPQLRGQQVRATQRFTMDPTPAATAEVATDRSSPTYSGVGPALVVVAAQHHRSRRPTHLRSEGSGSRDGGGGNSGGMTAEAAVIVVAASALVGLTLATTEGLRYDGWTGVGADHPLYLVGPRGEQYWVPLGKLYPDLAAWAVEGVIDEDDGPVERLERAPLDRAGFVFDLGFGAGRFAEPDGLNGPYAFFGRVGFGYFPIHELGFLAGLDIGIGSGEVEWRPHLEMQVIPFAFGPLHLGAFGQGGYLAGGVERADGTTVTTGSYYGGGGLVTQLDLTTRLA